MDVQELSKRLRDLARELRPPQRSAFFPLIPLAERLNTQVNLELRVGGARHHALSNLLTSPIDLTIFRRAQISGRRPLAPSDEASLHPRERFSIAHEYGHILAFRELRVQPQTDRRTYWAHETCMNEFAQHLLVPDWLLADWIHRSRHERPIPISALTTWGKDQCGVSREVVASALSRACPDVGFLVAAPCFSKKFSRTALRISFACSGSDIHLPPTHTHLICDPLMTLVSDRPFGSAELTGVSLGTKVNQDLLIKWQRTGGAPSSPAFWISLARRSPAPTACDDLTLDLLD